MRNDIPYDEWLRGMSRSLLLEHCLRTVQDELDIGVECSARKVYYNLVGEGVVPQDKRDPKTGQPTFKVYRRITNTIAEAKLEGRFPLDWLRDDLRPVHAGSVIDCTMDVESAMLEVESYLRWLPNHLISADRWYGQPRVPVVLMEKDTLVGVVRGPCREAEVPWYVCRGYSSVTGLWELAKYLHRLQTKATWDLELEILYIGDHDPEGLNIPTAVAKRLGQLYELKGWSNCPESWTRVALTKEQALDLGAVPMPVKLKSPRAKGYREKHGDDAWEVEAMPSLDLQHELTEAMDERFDQEIRDELEEQFPDLREEVRAAIERDGGELAQRAYA